MSNRDVRHEHLLRWRWGRWHSSDLFVFPEVSAAQSE
jgi:hypothetical protein